MSEIKTELTEKTINLKTKREYLRHMADHKTRTIIVFYSEIEYYLDGENEVIKNEEEKNYITSGVGYDNWEASEVGQAISAAILEELEKEIPGTQQ